MGRRRRLFSLMLVPMLVASACAKKEETAGGGGEDRPKVTIAFMGALTGPNASLEIGPRNAAALLIEQTNAQGELPVEIAFQPEDTKGIETPDAVTIAQKLRGVENLIGIVGPGFSGESKSAGDTLDAIGVPRITPSATATALGQRGWKYWFRGVASDAAQGGATPDVLTRYLKGTKVYIGHDKTEYGQGLAEIIRNKLKEQDPKLVAGFEGADPGKEDYSPLVTKAIASKADVFYWGGYEPESQVIVRQLKARGYTGKFVGGDGSKGSSIVKVPEADGVILTCPCVEPNTSSDAATKKFVADYKAKYNEAPTIYAAEGHDSALVLIEAIRKAGAPGGDFKAYREKVNENVRKTSALKGVATTYTFEDTGELKVDPKKAVFLYKITGKEYEPLGLVADLAK
jgi:branched-chain amino acid transport system substrate-binding protein